MMMPMTSTWTSMKTRTRKRMTRRALSQTPGSRNGSLTCKNKNCNSDKHDDDQHEGDDTDGRPLTWGSASFGGFQHQAESRLAQAATMSRARVPVQALPPALCDGLAAARAPAGQQ